MNKAPSTPLNASQAQALDEAFDKARETQQARTGGRPGGNPEGSHGKWTTTATEIPEPVEGDLLQQRLRTKLVSINALQEMRRAGLPRPPGVPNSHWLGTKQLHFKHENMALQFAAGRTVGEVARAFGYTVSRVSMIAQSPLMKLRVNELRSQHFGERVAQQFREMLEPAQEVYRNILDPSKSAPQGLRAKIAENVFNRVLGKPKETLEVSNKNINDLFALLDTMKKGENILDITPDGTDTQSMRPFSPNSSPDTIDETRRVSPVSTVEATLEPPKSPRNDDPFAAIDAWVTKLSPQGAT